MATLTDLDFSIIVPRENTNLMTNPSFETGIANIAANGSETLAQSAAYSRRGAYSLEITPLTNVNQGVYTNLVLASGTTYSFSCDVYTIAGQTYSVSIALSGNAKATTSFTGDGYWMRPTLTWTCDANGTYAFRLLRTSSGSTAKFYTDGWQIEAAASASTYFDGDLKGYVPTRQDFYWTGTPHASTSVRTAQTRAGGTEVRISSYAKVLLATGLGMGSFLNLATPTNLGGSFYQNSLAQGRTISMQLAFLGSNLGEIMANRDALIDALNPNLTAYPQPLTLRVRGYSSSALTSESMEPLDIPVVYSGGLEMAIENPYIEKAPVQFQVYLPYLQAAYDEGKALTVNSTVANAANILQRSASGTWASMGTGMNNSVRCLKIGMDGRLYAGGSFTTAGGTTVNRVAVWTGTAWAALGTTGVGNTVNAMAFGPDGSLYVGGEFTTAGGGSANYIAKWTGSAWAALGTGMGAIVDALAVGPDGTVYAGGRFTTAGGGSANYIAKWDGSAWSALGTGMNGSVKSLVIGQDGSLYAGGEFTTAGGTTVNYIAKWNGTAWSAMGTGMGTGGYVYALAVGADGSIYAGGLFQTAGGVSANYIAKWNGNNWSALGSGLGNPVGEPTYANGITAMPDGSLYVSGSFMRAGGMTLPDRIAIWNGSAWLPIDADVGTSSVYFFAAEMDKSGTVYVGGSWAATSATAAGATSTANSGTAKAYPVIRMTGPMTLYSLRNYTTGKLIYFNLTLQAGESATLDLNPAALTFKSDWRGNILSSILGGSTFDFDLAPGSNSIGVFALGTTAASAVSMRWKPQYQSIDGAKR